MPDRHLTDEEVWNASGNIPRVPTGVPKATCLNCAQEHTAFYCTQAHACRIDLAARKPYIDWLNLFRDLGYGVVKGDGYFAHDRIVTGRTALTYHLQSDLDLDPNHVLDDNYYARAPS